MTNTFTFTHTSDVPLVNKSCPTVTLDISYKQKQLLFAYRRTFFNPYVYNSKHGSNHMEIIFHVFLETAVILTSLNNLMFKWVQVWQRQAGKVYSDFCVIATVISSFNYYLPLSLHHLYPHIPGNTIQTQLKNGQRITYVHIHTNICICIHTKVKTLITAIATAIIIMVVVLAVLTTTRIITTPTKINFH